MELVQTELVLLKAKRIDNGEWVEGYYVKHGECDWIYTGKVDTLNEYDNHYGTKIHPAIKYLIDPSTICRCTGFLSWTDMDMEELDMKEEMGNIEQWQSDLEELKEGIKPEDNKPQEEKKVNNCQYRNSRKER